MRIAVIGVTPVGCTVAALLREAGHEVTLVGPQDKLARIASGGITVRQVWDGRVVTSFVGTAGRLSRKPGLLVFAPRMQDADEAAREVAPFVGDSTVAAIQHGTRPEQVLARHVPRDSIVTCVLTLGATCYGPGDVTLNFKGHMVVGRAYEADERRVDEVLAVMGRVFTAHKGYKVAHYNCTRLLLNLPYSIPAVVGEKIQKAFSDPALCRVAVMLLKEGVEVIEEAEVHIEPLPDFGEKALHALVAAPLDEAAARFGEVVMNMSKVPCQGPVLGSIERGEPSEVDYINGELVGIADALGRAAPLNALMVKLVHEVERTGAFMAKADFIAAVKSVM